MEDKTKKTLLAIGGIGLGLVACGTGGGLIGLASAGLLIRTGILKPQATIGKEVIKVITSSGQILKNTVAGTACITAGMKLGRDSATVLDNMRAERINYAPPPPRTIKVRVIEVNEDEVILATE